MRLFTLNASRGSKVSVVTFSQADLTPLPILIGNLTGNLNRKPFHLNVNKKSTKIPFKSPEIHLKKREILKLTIIPIIMET